MVELPTSISKIIQAIQTSFPAHYSELLSILGTTLLIVIYCVLLWKFHKFVTKKNIISLNLKKYNNSAHPSTRKFFAFLIFIFEYIIILPFIIFIWFTAFGIIILLLSGNKSIESAIVLSVAVISAIRILSYYKEELSRDVAKLMPLTILVIFVTNPEFYSLNQILQNVLEVPKFFVQITYYFIFIIALEIILRVVSLFSSSERGDE